MFHLTRKEIIFFCIWSSIILAIIIFPYIYGNLRSTAELQFMHFATPNYSDFNSYFAWIKQAAEGHPLFQDLFTTESQVALFFHPVFLFIGSLNHLFSIPIVFVWYLFIVLADIFLLVSVYLFISYFVADRTVRGLSYVLATVASGFGWFFGSYSVDNLMAETTIFQTLLWPFIFQLGLGLLLWFFILSIEAVKKNNSTLAWRAGMVGMLLVFIHPYDIVTAASTAGVYFLFFSPFIRRLKLISSIFLLPLVAVFLDLFILTMSPVLRSSISISMPSPSITFYVSGFGLLLVLACIGCIDIKRSREQKYYFLIVWIIVMFILVYMPFSFQRRLIFGVILPITVIASKKLMQLLRFSSPERNLNYFVRKFYHYLLFIFVVLFSLPTNVLYYYQNIQKISNREFPFYLSADVIESLQWLDNTIPADAIILSSYNLGNYIPRFTGNKVYVGHWAQTINVREKLDAVEFFYGEASPAERKRFLNQNGIDYVIVSRFEITDDERRRTFNLNGIAEIAFSNDSLAIWEVSNEQH